MLTAPELQVTLKKIRHRAGKWQSLGLMHRESPGKAAAQKILQSY